MFEQLKEKAQQAQALAQEKAQQAQAIAQQKAQQAQAMAQSSLDTAKQKVAELDASRFKELKESAVAKGLGMLPPGMASDRERDAEDDSTGDEATNEKERLVGGPDLRAGVSALGSKLSKMRQGSLTNLGQSCETLIGGAKSLSADRLNQAAAARDAALDSARAVGGKSVDTLRSAKAAGSAACASGADKLRAAKDGARERCGDALSAASAVSGVSLARREEPKTAVGRLCARLCPALTYKQRLIGAASCMAIGLLLSLTSMLSFTKLLLGNPAPFAYKYTVGNLLSLGATSFLVGPARQCRDMMHSSRRVASLAYFGTLAGTLLSVFVFHLIVLCLLFILLQFCALAWYTLSYVPYGQSAARSIVRRLLKRAGIELPGAKAAASVSPMSNVVAVSGAAGGTNDV